MCTINNTRGRLFGPDGCQVPIGNGVCGETKTLDIINEFKRLYEEKMQEIDTAGGGDCLQEKLRLQQEWIGNLTEQNELLVRAVEELEHEATERVHILEEKLKHSAQCICEVMNRYRKYDVTNDLLAEPLKRVFCLENDVKNLLEFIRRIRDGNEWSDNGLKFYEISNEELFGAVSGTDENRLLISDITKEETKRKDRESTIQELQGKIAYFNSFGDVEALATELKCRNEECTTLKQAMVDMRQALTEEVASKHDIILKLKKDGQDLEERCIQADKQTAFRDDIIKELRKEIKQLKQQLTQEEIAKLNVTIDDLQINLNHTKDIQQEEERRKNEEIRTLNNIIDDLQHCLQSEKDRFEKEVKVCKICKGRSKVGFADSVEVQTCLDQTQLEKQIELIENKDEIIKVQNDTLGIMQQEMQSLKERESDMKSEKDKWVDEVQNLKLKISELENALEDSEGKAANLQMAVDLYLNSINVLEASEEKYKMEIHQQKSTISNLQEALVAAKQELNVAKNKSEEHEIEQNTLFNKMSVMMTDIEFEKENLMKQYIYISDEFDRLQELNFGLEVEHCNSLQDVDVLDSQVFKYQKSLKCAEEEIMKYKSQLKKLLKQKKCYEEVINYFQQEMGLMSEQLQKLQELLTLSNDNAQEETCKLMQAFMNVQVMNEQLSTELSAAEQKVLLENQMNQLQGAKICELERVISEKEIDLGRHDQAIVNIRQTLQCSLKQNEELHSTIVTLNDTIIQLQNAIRKYEADNCRSKESTLTCQTQIISCKEKLEELKTALSLKTTELCKIEMAYSNQNRLLKSAQMELKEMKEKQKDKQCHLKCVIADLRDKLSKCEDRYKNIFEEFTKLQTALDMLTRKESVKDTEIKRYREIIRDLKKTLMDLNKSLTKTDFQSKCTNAECKKFMDQSEEIKDQDICLNCPCEVEFYQSIVETLKKSVIELKKKLAETQKQNQQLEEESKRKDAQLVEIAKTQMEKDKECNELRQELMDKLQQTQREESRYVELANQFERELGAVRQELEVRTIQLNDVKKSAQEINSSRCVQLACAQEEVNTLKEELNRLLRKHCALNVENEKLHTQSVRMQSTVTSLEEKSQLLKGQLEQYLLELQNVQIEKEALVAKNQELLTELRHIQSSFSEASRQQRELQCHYQQPQGPCIKNLSRCLKNHSPPPTCQSPWSLGSQGTASIHEESPSRSPCPNEGCDWYSPTFKNESEEDDEDDWVSKVEDLAAQVRRTNKMWRSKMGSEYVVTKDTKK